jgi:hypothetical protein
LFKVLASTLLLELFPLELCFECEVGEAGKVFEHNLVKLKFDFEAVNLFDVVEAEVVFVLGLVSEV